VGLQPHPPHPIPPAHTSPILAASTPPPTPSTHDTTRLFSPPHRLKNTPIPGRGGTTGTWYALTTFRPKQSASAPGRSARPAQLKEKSSPPPVQGSTRSIRESGCDFRDC